MMNRRPPSPLTEEDRVAWAQVLIRFAARARRTRGSLALLVYSGAADQRDADLMLAIGTLHIATGGDWSLEAQRARQRLRQQLLAIADQVRPARCYQHNISHCA